MKPTRLVTPFGVARDTKFNDIENDQAKHTKSMAPKRLGQDYLLVREAMRESEAHLLTAAGREL
jgi:hypothetical protein